MVEIFIGFAETLAHHALAHGVREAFRAVVQQEILETDLNRLVSEPFKSACDHLQDAALQPDNASRQREHLENARLKFVEASNVDAPLPAARAAFYAGICFRLLGEERSELRCYENSLAMFSAMESRLDKKLSESDSVPKAMLFSAIKITYLPAGSGRIQSSG